jgi:hypothetical protein
MAAGLIDDAALAALIAGGMDPEEAGVHQVLSVCGIPNASRIHFVAEGFTLLLSFRDYSSKELDNVAKVLQGRPEATRVQLGLVPLKNLKALTYWIQDNRRRDITSDSTELLLRKCISFVTVWR